MEISFMLTWMSVHIKTIVLELKSSLTLFSRGEIAALHCHDPQFMAWLCRQKWLKNGSRGLFGTITERNVGFCTYTLHTLRGREGEKEIENEIKRK